eukprot:4288348-Pyramimonas_sp.AAC.1
MACRAPSERSSSARGGIPDWPAPVRHGNDRITSRTPCICSGGNVPHACASRGSSMLVRPW